MRSGDTSAECGVRNAECIGRWSIRAAGSRDRTRRLNSAFRIPHSALGGAVMGGVWLAIDTATEIASVAARRPPRARSEEHTPGLQSRSDLVCRLLLEKKNRSVDLFLGAHFNSAYYALLT